MDTTEHSRPNAPAELHAGLSAGAEGRPARKDGFFDDFLRFFKRGLAALLPTLITLLLLFKLWEILWDYLGRHIIAALVWGHQQLQPYPKPVGVVRWLWYDQMHPWQRELLGVALAIVAVYIVGLFVGNFIGRTAWRLAEASVMRIPLIRAIYPAVKQVTDFLLNDRRSSGWISGGASSGATRVVAVQPHAEGIWSIGLVTGGIKLGAADSHPGLQDMVTVFVPSSPTAFSGYVLVVPRQRVVELPLSVEEAMRLLITGGVSGPTQGGKRIEDRR